MASTRSPTSRPSEVGELEHRKGPARTAKLQDREVGALVLEDDVAIELAPVGQRHLHLVGIGDDVIVGDDDARRVDEDARAERALDALAGRPESGSPKKRRKNGSAKKGEACTSTTREA